MLNHQRKSELYAHDMYVTTGELNRHDVLFGRGSGINDHPGNVHFRQVVAARKAEYVQAPTSKLKSQIAGEVVHRIRCELSPPGRFLKRATPDDVRRLGVDAATVERAAAEDAALLSPDGRGTSTCGIWIPVTEAVALERAKMSLRRQGGGDMKEEEPQNDTHAMVAVASGESALNDSQLMGADGNVPRNGALGDGARKSSSNGAIGSNQVYHSSIPNRNLQLLSTLRSVREVVQSLRETHDGASPTRTSAAGDSPNVSASAVTSEMILSSLLQRQQRQRSRSDSPMTSLTDAASTLKVRQTSHASVGPAPTFAVALHSLGTELYRTLAAGDSAAMVASDGVRPRPEGNGDGRSSKRERRHDEARLAHGAAPLQDLGCPTNISIFVQSLIDATDEDAIERFTSLSDVENDLRLMIDFPTKYLFDPLNETSTGRLGLSQELYGIERQRERLMNAFQSVVVTGEESHGLALVSGRSGSGKVRSSVTIIATYLMGFRLASIYLTYLVHNVSFLSDLQSLTLYLDVDIARRGNERSP
jgi:hypothetical protein